MLPLMKLRNISFVVAIALALLTLTLSGCSKSVSGKVYTAEGAKSLFTQIDFKSDVRAQVTLRSGGNRDLPYTMEKDTVKITLEGMGGATEELKMDDKGCL